MDQNVLNGTLQQAVSSIKSANDSKSLDAVRVQYMGKNGILTEFMRQLGTLPPEQKRETGQQLNIIKSQIIELLDEQQRHVENFEILEKMNGEWMDVSLPSRAEYAGTIHPISHTIQQVISIFGAMGFKMAEGPHIEDDFHNFSALNIPDHHPARQMQDTFYLRAQRDGLPLVLRTHTSPVQIRTMRQQKPPIRIIVPGRTFRSDSDATHTPMFHQVEGLVVEEKIHMGHLKGCLETFCRIFFGQPDLKLRFRASYFPFTEPSAEVDIGCTLGKDKIILGEGEDWLEILGCGMIHNKVLENCGLDPQKYQGFAFGMGIERIAMLKYGIPDLRDMFDPDLRWHQHYGFSWLTNNHVTFGLE